MKTQEIIVGLKDGLSSQTACTFIQKANQFSCQLYIHHSGHRVNAKSLLGVLSLNITPGTAISLVADGPDEQDASATLAAFLQPG